MLRRISQSCPLTVTSLLSVTTRKAMFTPLFLRNQANGSGFSYRFQHHTCYPVHCCTHNLVGPTSPASQLPENRKNFLISPMLGDSIPHLYSKTFVYKGKSIFVLFTFDCIHRQGFSFKTQCKFFRVFYLPALEFGWVSKTCSCRKSSNAFQHIACVS